MQSILGANLNLTLELTKIGFMNKPGLAITGENFLIFFIYDFNYFN